MSVTESSTQCRFYVGWYRQSRRARWRALVQADDYATCEQELLAKIAGEQGETMITRSGESPIQPIGSRLKRQGSCPTCKPTAAK